MRQTAFSPRSRGRHRRGTATGAGGWRLVSAFSLLLAMLFYAAAPLATLWQAADGIRTRDPMMLRAALDWSSVRDGLKQDIGAAPPLALAGAAAPVQDELPSFGESFATTVASHVIDNEVTPETVIGMLSAPSAVSTADGWRAALARIARLHFSGPTRFDAAIRMKTTDASPLLVSLRLSRWQWRITRIHLPADDDAAPAARTDRT